MAHPNIDDRQARVKALLDAGELIDAEQSRTLAYEFSCSPSAIRADIKSLTKDRAMPSMHTSAAMRKRIRTRDGRICQYCGTVAANREYVIDHVIPAPRAIASKFQ